MVEKSDEGVVMRGMKNFRVADIFECGQSFRFERTGDNEYEGVACGRYLKVGENEGENGIDVTFYNTTLDDFYEVWYDYFDLGRDYGKIGESYADDDVLYRAYKSCSGVRILRQEPFECLISFIISQNNNIPRIKKIVARLCELLGEKFTLDNRTHYKFPTAQSIVAAGTDALDMIKSGFRAKYIYDAAEKINSGIIELESVKKMPLCEASAYLRQINGVGPKVSACVLLFGYAKFDAFPIDVWVKRIIEKYYGGGDFSETIFGEYPGIAQQYLFHYERVYGNYQT